MHKYMVSFVHTKTTKTISKVTLYELNEQNVYNEVMKGNVTRHAWDGSITEIFVTYDSMLYNIITNKGIVFMNSFPTNEIILTYYIIEPELFNLLKSYETLKIKMLKKATIAIDQSLSIIETLQFSLLLNSGNYEELYNKINSILLAYEL